MSSGVGPVVDPATAARSLPSTACADSSAARIPSGPLQAPRKAHSFSGAVAFPPWWQLASAAWFDVRSTRWAAQQSRGMKADSDTAWNTIQTATQRLKCRRRRIIRLSA